MALRARACPTQSAGPSALLRSHRHHRNPGRQWAGQRAGRVLSKPWNERAHLRDLPCRKPGHEPERDGNPASICANPGTGPLVCRGRRCELSRTPAAAMRRIIVCSWAMGSSVSSCRCPRMRNSAYRWCTTPMDAPWCRTRTAASPSSPCTVGRCRRPISNFLSTHHVRRPRDARAAQQRADLPRKPEHGSYAAGTRCDHHPRAGGPASHGKPARGHRRIRARLVQRASL